MILCDSTQCDYDNYHCGKKATFFYRIDYLMPLEQSHPQSLYVARCIYHGVHPSVENRWIIDENTYLVSTIHES